MNFKETLYRHCNLYVDARKDRIQQEIDRAQESANEETKSSVGDKYETGRAMAQLEIERNMQQMSETEKLVQALKNIDVYRKSDSVIPGSLVSTTHGVFFIAISIGVVTIDQKQFMVVSADSPIGKSLMGKKVGEVLNWNKQSYTIKAIE